MKKSVSLAALILALPLSAANAADLPTKKESAVAPVASPTWTGGYIGMNAGGTWANSTSMNAVTWTYYNSPVSTALLNGGVPTGSAAGFIGGGQIGYNWQSQFTGHDLVTGIEADIQGVAGSSSYGNLQRMAAYTRFDAPQSMLSNARASSTLNYLGTVRGRIGYLVRPSLLVYGTGGLAYGGVSTGITNAQTYTDIPGAMLVGRNSYSNTQVGWTAGGGIEWMFMQNWSAKAEYLYYDLGRGSSTAINNVFYSSGFVRPQGLTQYSTHFNGNIVRLGVNYHMNFAAAPVIAKF
jgi:outer membrane immunogenic protein